MLTSPIMDPDELSIIFYLREKLRIPQVKKKIPNWCDPKYQQSVQLV